MAIRNDENTLLIIGIRKWNLSSTYLLQLFQNRYEFNWRAGLPVQSALHSPNYFIYLILSKGNSFPVCFTTFVVPEMFVNTRIGCYLQINERGTHKQTFLGIFSAGLQLTTSQQRHSASVLMKQMKGKTRGNRQSLKI